MCWAYQIFEVYLNWYIFQFSCVIFHNAWLFKNVVLMAEGRTFHLMELRCSWCWLKPLKPEKIIFLQIVLQHYVLRPIFLLKLFTFCHTLTLKGFKRAFNGSSLFHFFSFAIPSNSALTWYFNNLGLNLVWRRRPKYTILEGFDVLKTGRTESQTWHFWRDTISKFHSSKKFAEITFRL